jgi:hypothetical protein
VLEVSGREILPLGRVGEASLIKIATNMISAATTGILAEAYGLISKAGVDPQRFAEALEQNACYSGLVAMKLPQMMARDYEPHFSLKHMFKDAQYALNLGRQLGVEEPVLSTTASVMFRAIQKGHGEQDYSVLASRYQDDSDKKFTAPARPFTYDIPPLPSPGRWFPLVERAIFRLTGPDRVRYLNGQVTNDVAGPLDQKAIAACLCNIKGRVEALVHISADGDSLIVDGELAQREAIHARLERYLIADDCEIHDETGHYSPRASFYRWRPRGEIEPSF